MILSIGLLMVGLVLLTKGADIFIEGASSLATKFKIPQIIIGLTIVAMGTSAPEASVSINSALKGINGVAIGNIFGSNIINVLFILGATAMVSPLLMKKETVKFEIPFTVFVTTLLCGLGYYFHSITREAAFVLLFFFGLYLVYLFKMAKKHDANSVNNEIQPQQSNLFKMILFIILGLGALVYGSDLTVNSAINIARMLNISERVIGLTIVAIGTSLPELVTCVVAALKQQCDLAIGNIVGSNLFNILFVLGITGVIQPMNFDIAFLFDGIIAILAVIFLFLFTVRDKYLCRKQGFILVVFYIGYLAYLIIK